jgi:hypothetical protein
MDAGASVAGSSEQKTRVQTQLIGNNYPLI